MAPTDWRTDMGKGVCVELRGQPRAEPQPRLLSYPRICSNLNTSAVGKQNKMDAGVQAAFSFLSTLLMICPEIGPLWVGPNPDGQGANAPKTGGEFRWGKGRKRGKRKGAQSGLVEREREKREKERDAERRERTKRKK